MKMFICFYVVIKKDRLKRPSYHIISVNNDCIELVCVPSSPVIKSIYPYKLVIPPYNVLMDASCAVSFA